MKLNDSIKVLIWNWKGIEKVWKIVFENVRTLVFSSAGLVYTETEVLCVSCQ